jgi:hypothetical protein
MEGNAKRDAEGCQKADWCFKGRAEKIQLNNWE